jgi:hypothetical protein
MTNYRRKSRRTPAFAKPWTFPAKKQAKSLDLRAAMSLTRLYRQQGRPAQAGPVLAETYGWFTGGFGTPDSRYTNADVCDLLPDAWAICHAQIN